MERIPTAEDFVWAAWLVGVAPRPNESAESFILRCGDAFLRFDEWSRNPHAVLWNEPGWTRI